MTNQELQARVEAFSMGAFPQPFNHQAVFNARLRTAGGRFYPATMNLDFNPKIFALYPSDVTDGIIKHELVHYHLFAQHRGYQHRDHDFKQLLAAVWRLAVCSATADERPTLCLSMYKVWSAIRSAPTD